MIIEDIQEQDRLSKNMEYWHYMQDVVIEDKGVRKLVKDYWFKSKVAKDWRFIEEHIENPIRNTNQEYLFFINSSVFRNEAAYFEKHGYYTKAPEGTYAYNLYWNEQEKRCKNGYIVEGVRITGRMYFMLNFSRMRATKVDPKTGNIVELRKEIRFPRFLDHQFYLFNEMEEAIGESIFVGKPKESFVMLKSRRKGMTYVIGAGVIVHNYTFLLSSNNVLAAGESDHYKATLDAVWFTVNHLDANTEFGQNRHKKRALEHFKASYVDRFEGREIEKGSLAEVRFASFKDNAFKSIGESVDFMGFEEAGKFKNLRKALRISEPTYREGDYYTGVSMIWGTGGDMTGGGSADLSEIFYKPSAYGFKEYKNIYDEHGKGNCGWFIDDMWYYPGEVEVDGKKKRCVDGQGNSFRKYAEMLLDKKRKKSMGAGDYDTFITQQPKTPAEALMVTLGITFPAKMINDRLSELMSDGIELDSRWVGRFIMNKEGVLDFEHTHLDIPLDDYPIDNKVDLKGAIVLYHKPDRNSKGLVFKNRYIAGIDPYAQDTSVDSVSVGACYVFDRITRRIIAEYVGRPNNTDDFHRQVMYLLLYYNARANYENQVPGFDKFFEKYNNLHLLAEQPGYIKQISPNSKVNRPYGCHASAPIITAYVALIKNWLLSRDEILDNGRYMLHSINSIGLLRELLRYGAGNFDRVVAMGMVMILDKELESIEVESGEGNINIDRNNEWYNMAFNNKEDRDSFLHTLKYDIESEFAI